MNKNIMFVMNQMTSGGAERVVSILANGMSERGNRVSLVITFNSEIHYEINNKIEIIKFNINKELSQVSRNIKEIKSLIKLLKEKRPDVIISFIRNVNCIIAANIVGIPVIISERNNPKYDPKSKIWRVLRKIIYPYADGIVFQTEGAKSYFSKKIKDKSITIPNPLLEDIPMKTNYKDQRKEIVTIGRLSEQKDQITIIKAFSEINKKNSDYKLIIYGEGELREKLKEQIGQLGLNDFIEMPGNFKDIHKKIKEADIFVLSSKYEGYPNALIEAMAIGLPVISTKCEYGPTDILENYINGVLIPVGDFESMAKEIEKLIFSYSKRKSLGQNAIRIREKLELNLILDKWLEYISKSIDFYK